MSYPGSDDVETPEADAVEQATSAQPDDDGDADIRTDRGVEAPEWDADGERIVALEDDYR